ncbi:MAG: cytochrome-c peroxidase [Methylophilaceae bacterium]
MKFIKIGLVVLFAVLIAAFVIKINPPTPPAVTLIPVENEARTLVSSAPVTPIPLTLNANPQKAALGQKLFSETRLSRDNSISCASCHTLSTGGVDGKRYSTGTNGKINKVNTPTVLNAALGFRQFWDGRAVTLEEQVELVLTLPEQMNSDWEITLAKLRTDANYTRQFAKLYADGLTKANVANAIAEFERTLITPNARFDKFLRGDANAISFQEKEGFETFKRYGCVSCHQGVLLGGNMFERMGSVRDYFKDRGNIQPADLGHYNVTHNETHRYYFKVSSLRNIEKTAPYFHDGSAKTMAEAVETMAKYNLGITMAKQDVNNIVAFFKTLTGDAPAPIQSNPL